VESAIGTLGEAERRNEWSGTATKPRREIVSEAGRMRKSGKGVPPLLPCFLQRVRKRLKRLVMANHSLGKSEKECVSARKQRRGNSRFFWELRKSAEAKEKERVISD
jgi:hypothetical protein